MQLQDIRVIDLTRIISGPFCTMLLGDLGADVIKIETPEGDPVRAQGEIAHGLSWYFASFNRNKRSVVLDLRSSQGLAALRALIADADVLVDNFRPGVMDAMGLDWPALQQLNPRIVHTSITGFGADGPYAQRPAFDFIAQAMSGFMSLNGDADTGPMRSGVPISDLIAGNYAALGTVAALLRRERSGRGERVGAALLDAMVSYGAYSSANFLLNGELPPATGNDHPLVSPYGMFAASDGEIAVAPSNDAVVRKFLHALGLQGLLDEPRFANNAERVRQRAQLTELINQVTQQQPKEHWIAVLNAAGVPCGVVQNLAEVFDDPQIAHQQMVLSVEHPGHGQVRMTGFPMKFGTEPCRLRYPAPELGADSDTLLRSIGARAGAPGERQ